MSLPLPEPLEGTDYGYWVAAMVPFICLLKISALENKWIHTILIFTLQKISCPRISVMNPVALSSRRREEQGKMEKASFLCRCHWFLLKSSRMIALAHSSWIISSFEKLKSVQGGIRKCLSPRGWVMSRLSLGFRLWQMGFSYNPKKSMDEAAGVTQENLMRHGASLPCFLRLLSWPADTVVVFVSLFLVCLSTADHRNGWRRGGPASQPGLAFQPPQTSHVPNCAPHSVSSLGDLTWRPQSCK